MNQKECSDSSNSDAKPSDHLVVTLYSSDSDPPSDLVYSDDHSIYSIAVRGLLTLYSEPLYSVYTVESTVRESEIYRNSSERHCEETQHLRCIAGPCMMPTKVVGCAKSTQFYTISHNSTLKFFSFG